MGAMQSMELEYLGWGPDQISILAEALPFAKELRVLRLEYNPVGPKGAAMLAKTLPQCQRLQKIVMIGVQNRFSRARTSRNQEKHIFYEMLSFFYDLAMVLRVW